MIRRLPTTWYISLGLAMLTISIVFAADFIGLIPKPLEAVMEGRKQLAESLAIQCAVCAERNDHDAIKATMQLVVDRNDNVHSAALRTVDGSILAQTDGYVAPLPKDNEEETTTNRTTIPLFAGDEQWGTMEILFEEPTTRGLWGLSMSPVLIFVIFVGLTGFVVYALFLKRVLRYLDPDSVVPKRVKAALDSLVEGVALFDKDERIVLTNSAFARNTGRRERSLLGLKASELSWKLPSTEGTPDGMPWSRALREDHALPGVPLVLSGGPDGERKLMVNAAPIHDEHGGQHGVLATFDDVTEIEEKNEELRETLRQLNRSRDEIQRQNRQLEQLAAKDPLTGCLNRRSFLDRLKTECSMARQHNYTLACIMVDIDHFKSINDQHGHSTGDEVLRFLSQTLKAGVRATDAVCRYGGEEFCILLSHTDIDKGMQIAEGLRGRIEANRVQGIRVTASFGVACLTSEGISLQQLIDQADKALYVAKDTGRNKVVRWDRISETEEQPEEAAADSTESTAAADAPAQTHSTDELNVRAVEVLVAALAHRDLATAEHSGHVADLCTVTARKLMSNHDALILKVAAQLHDIGKLGVPDAILHKEDALTEEEMRTVHDHLRFGVETVASTCSSSELTKILSNRYAWYGGNSREPDLPTGNDIPLGARILAICDSFSAMVSPRPFRDTRSHDEAFAELRRCAGTQFDPELVEVFIEIISNLGRPQTTETAPAPDEVLSETTPEPEEVSSETTPEPEEVPSETTPEPDEVPPETAPDPDEVLSELAQWAHQHSSHPNSSDEWK